jgi:hypothetical protein
MPARNSDPQHRRRVLPLLAATMAMAGLAGCSTGTTGPEPVVSTPQPSFSLALPAPRSAGPPPAPTNATSAPTSPQNAAMQWLIAYHSMSWSDHTPTAWITQVQPYVTPSLNRSDQQYADDGGGADWTDFVSKQCTSTVGDIGAVIPDEAPGTPTAVNIQVTGTVTTTCTSGAPDDPAESVSATLVVVPGPNGSWLVNQRLY